MADIKISELPTATSVNDTDIFVMDQSLVTKTATRAQILASITPAGIGAVATSDIISISSGGTGATSQQAALNALAGAVTSNQVLKGNGTNVTLSALTSADIPTLGISQVSGAITTAQIYALTGDVTSSIGNPATTVVKLQGSNVATTAPSSGQVLAWDGTQWAPATASTGGGGGANGLTYYLNQGTAADAPTTNIPNTPKQLGRTGETGQTSITTGTLTQNTWVLVGGFVSESTPVDPATTTIPAGLWDFNIWAFGDANISAGTSIRARAYTYDGTTLTLLGTSGGQVINGTSAQYSLSVLVAQTTVALTDRIYIAIEAFATGNNHTVTAQFGDGTPSHVHTSLPLVGGTGLWKNVSGVLQSPASLLVDADVDAAAGIALSKIAGAASTASVAAITAESLGALSTAQAVTIAQGGTGAIDAGTALFNLGCPAHYVVIRASSSQVPLVVAGTYQATLTSSTTVTLTTGDTSLLAIGMTFSATALRNFAIASIVNSTTFTISGTPTSLGSVATSVYTTSNNTFTYALGAQAAIESRTVVVGDVILFSNQNQSTTTGPWVCTVQGAAGVSQVMTRPSWFTGTGYPIACTLQRGNVSAGQTYSVYQQIAADSDLAIGQVALTASLVAARGSVAVLGGNTFSGKNTLVAGSAILNPLSFQAGVVLTTPTAHAIEWDGTQMYVSNLAAERLAVATSKVQINAQTGTTYTFAAVDAGYLVTAANAAAIAVTVPLNATIPLPIGTQILLMQLGAGQVTVAGFAGVTVSGKNGLKTSGQYAVISLIKIATDAWVLGGDAAV